MPKLFGLDFAVRQCGGLTVELRNPGAGRRKELASFPAGELPDEQEIRARVAKCPGLADVLTAKKIGNVYRGGRVVDVPVVLSVLPVAGSAEGGGDYNADIDTLVLDGGELASDAVALARQVIDLAAKQIESADAARAADREFMTGAVEKLAAIYKDAATSSNLGEAIKAMDRHASEETKRANSATGAMTRLLQGSASGGDWADQLVKIAPLATMGIAALKRVAGNN